MAKNESKADRWADAAARAREAMEALQELRDEYQDWLDNLPDNLQNSATADKLNEICNLDLDSACDIIEEAEMADLPMGFGRD